MKIILFFFIWQSLEEHCNGQRKIQVALHGHILQLYSEIGQLKKPSITQHGKLVNM